VTPDALLLAAGWTPLRAHRGVWWWRDPAGGEDYPEWRAVEIATRDREPVTRGLP